MANHLQHRIGLQVAQVHCQYSGLFEWFARRLHSHHNLATTDQFTLRDTFEVHDLARTDAQNQFWSIGVVKQDYLLDLLRDYIGISVSFRHACRSQSQVLATLCLAVWLSAKCCHRLLSSRVGKHFIKNFQNFVSTCLLEKIY